MSLTEYSDFRYFPKDYESIKYANKVNKDNEYKRNKKLETLGFYAYDSKIIVIDTLTEKEYPMLRTMFIQGNGNQSGGVNLLTQEDKTKIFKRISSYTIWENIDEDYQKFMVRRELNNNSVQIKMSDYGKTWTVRPE